MINNINNWKLWIRKNKFLFNLTGPQLDIDKINLYVKDPYETKYHLLISKRESTRLKRFNDSKAFIEQSNDMDYIYKHIEQYNPNYNCFW